MSVSARENPKAPHNQPFQMEGRRNRKKVNSWWNSASSSYWRNKRRDKIKKESD